MNYYTNLLMRLAIILRKINKVLVLSYQFYSYILFNPDLYRNMNYSDVFVIYIIITRFLILDIY